MERSQAVVRAVLVARIDSIPPLPHTCTRLLDLDEKKDSFFDELIRVIEHDPAMVIRLIGMVNSAAFRGAGPVRKLSEAVLRIGASKTRSFLVSVGLAGVFTPKHASSNAVWLHALTAATLSRTLTSRCYPMEGRPHEAYLLGLLHDVGSFILHGVLPDAVTSLETDDEACIRAELALCGLDHAEIGARAATRWGFGPHLIEVLRRHHETAPVAGPVGRDLEILRMADAVALENSKTPAGLDGDDIDKASPRIFAVLSKFPAARTRSSPELLVAAVRDAIAAARLEHAMLLSGS